MKLNLPKLNIKKLSQFNLEQFDNIPSKTLKRRKIGYQLMLLKQPWYKKPVYLGVLIPGIIALLSFIIAIYTGVFDARKKELEVERQILTLQITEFKTTKDSLNEINNGLIASLQEKEQIIENTEANYKEQINSLYRGKSELELNLSNVKLTLQQTDSLYKNRVTELESLVKNLLDKEKYFKIAMNQKRDTIKTLLKTNTSLNVNLQKTKIASKLNETPKEDLYKDIQNKLSVLGYYNGSIDGIIGMQSKNDIQTFKQKYKLENNGILDRKTIIEILFTYNMMQSN